MDSNSYCRSNFYWLEKGTKKYGGEKKGEVKIIADNLMQLCTNLTK